MDENTINQWEIEQASLHRPNLTAIPPKTRSNRVNKQSPYFCPPLLLHNKKYSHGRKKAAHNEEAGEQRFCGLFDSSMARKPGARVLNSHYVTICLPTFRAGRVRKRDLNATVPALKITRKMDWTLNLLNTSISLNVTLEVWQIFARKTRRRVQTAAAACCLLWLWNLSRFPDPPNNDKEGESMKLHEEDQRLSVKAAELVWLCARQQLSERAIPLISQFIYARAYMTKIQWNWYWDESKFRGLNSVWLIKSDF
jgi:hypothetical protein